VHGRLPAHGNTGQPRRTYCSAAAATAAASERDVVWDIARRRLGAQVVITRLGPPGWRVLRVELVLYLHFSLSFLPGG
jgi:hypothetical protein